MTVAVNVKLLGMPQEVLWLRMSSLLGMFSMLLMRSLRSSPAL